MVTKPSGDGPRLTCCTAALAPLWESWKVNGAACSCCPCTCLTLPATEWLEDVGPFDVALVLLGINDAAKGLASDFKTHYSSIVSAIAGLPFKPDIILAKPLPILSREFVASSQVIANAVEETGRDSGALSACRVAPHLLNHLQAPPSLIWVLESIPMT